MSLVGNLKEMPLAEVLEFVGSAKSSGKLMLTSVDRSGLIVFRNGLVIYAASNSVRETLGSLLVYRGLIDTGTLQRALETQHHAREERRLGSILVEQGALSLGTLRDVIHSQVRTVIRELGAWKDGFFRFEAMSVAERGEVEVDASDFLLVEGIAAASLTRDVAPTAGTKSAGEAEPVPAPISVATSTAVAEPEETAQVEPIPALELDGDFELADDAFDPERERRARPTAGTPSDDEAEPFELESEPAAEPEPELVTLRAFMSSPMSPWFTGEVALAVLRCAEDAVRRCVLFSVRGDRLVGMGGFGVIQADGESEKRLREVSIPLDQPSVLAFAVGTGESYRGNLHDTDGDRLLLAALGNAPAGEVIVLPLAVSGRVVAVLYGDNGPDGGAIRSTKALESVMREAGLAMARGLAFEPSGQR